MTTQTQTGLALFTGGTQFTDATGRFALRSARLAGPLPVGSALDTVSAHTVIP